MRGMALGIPGILLAVLIGCAPKDSDEDGLTDKEEEELGTNPEAADSDGDRVKDSDEVNLGSDPLVVDSDGDGYDDGDEIDFRKNPIDPESGIYEGRWPYNPSKDDITDPGWGGTAEVDGTLPRFAWPDQHDEVVDIYDFAFQGKPIILDLSEYRCYWCHETAKLLEGEANEFDGYGYEPLKTLIENGDVYWVTVIDGDFQSGDDVDEDMIEDWMQEFPNDHVPVLMDEERKLADWMDILGYPTMILVEEDMTVSMVPEAYYEVWDEVLTRF